MIPALIFQTALGWRVIFPTWEPIGQRPSWSIRGVGLVTLGVAISIWTAQFAPHNSGSFLVTAMMASGIASVLLPILALILKSRHYFRWFLVIICAALGLPVGLLGILAIFEIVGDFPWLFGLPTGILFATFCSYSLLPFLIARSGGALLWEAHKAGQKVDKNHQKLT